MKQALSILAFGILLWVGVFYYGYQLNSSKVAMETREEKVKVSSKEEFSNEVHENNGEDIESVGKFSLVGKTGRIHLFRNISSDPSEYARVVFDDGHAVYDMPDMRVSAYEGSRYILVDEQKLFFVDYRGDFKVFTAEDGVTNVNLSLPLAHPPAINDFYVYKNKAFFIHGHNCNTYDAECFSQLVEYDFQTDQTFSHTRMGEVRSNRIIGYKEGVDELYMTHESADAGCFEGLYEVYKLGTREFSELGKYSGCGDFVGGSGNIYSEGEELVNQMDILFSKTPHYVEGGIGVINGEIIDYASQCGDGCKVIYRGG